MRRFHQGEQAMGATHLDRVELLIRLYEATIETIREAGRHQAGGRHSDAVAAFIRAERLVLEIIGGLDVDLGPIPQDVRRLCHFAVDSLATREPSRLESTANMFSTLKDAFEGIREQVRQLEQSGELPPNERPVMLNTMA